LHTNYKKVEKRLKEERIEQEPDNYKTVKSECHSCGQNWLWCICDHNILNEVNILYIYIWKQKE